MFRSNWRSRLPELAVFALWGVAVAGRFARNGAIYGLDFSLVQPDGVRYQALTLRLMGESWVELSQRIQHFYAGHALHPIAGAIEISESSSVMAVAWSRPLYSFLSVPFVTVFGDWGMLAVPILSLLIFSLILLRVGRFFNAPWVAVVVVAALTASPTFLRWMILNCTDALALALFALLALALLTAANGFAISALVVLTLTARPVGPAVMMLMLPFALRSGGTERAFLLAAMGISAIHTVTLLLLQPELATYSESGSEPSGLMHQLLQLPQHLVTVPVVEFGQLAVMDRLLLALVLIALWAAVRDWRDVWSQAFILTLLTTGGMGIWMGALGANFRLQLPSLVPMAFLLTKSASNLLETRRLCVVDSPERNGEGKWRSG